MFTMHVIGLALAVITGILAIVLIRGANKVQKSIEAECAEKVSARER